MPKKTRNCQGPPLQPEQPKRVEPVASNTGVLVVSSLQDHWRRCPRVPGQRPGDQEVLAEGTGPTGVEAEEFLVADPRGALTPAQMVERKLMVLLSTGRPGVVLRGGLAPLQEAAGVERS